MYTVLNLVGKTMIAYIILFGGQGDLQTLQVIVGNKSPL